MKVAEKAVAERAIADTGILPVINIPEIKLAVPLAQAIQRGGLSAMEVTLRSVCALDAVKAIKAACDRMYVGVGTVLSIEDAERALEAGADFIVCPGCDPGIIDACLERGVSVYPGCSSPSEIQMCLAKGISVIKFFPSEFSGGNEAIKLLSGPFAKARFIPTGGINFNNLSDYMGNKAVLACGGSFMAPASEVKNQNFDKVTELCRQALKISLGFELAHIGLNSGTEEEAMHWANRLAGIFQFNTRVCEKSVFTDRYCEFMKTRYYGRNGHIGFYTNSVSRALAWFEKNKVKVKYDTLKKKADGTYEFVYLEDEIAGFAIHVVTK